MWSKVLVGDSSGLDKALPMTFSQQGCVSIQRVVMDARVSQRWSGSRLTPCFGISWESGATMVRVALNVDDGTREEESVMCSKILVGGSSGLGKALPMTFSWQGRVCRQSKRNARAAFWNSTDRSRAERITALCSRVWVVIGTYSGWGTTFGQEAGGWSGGRCMLMAVILDC